MGNCESIALGNIKNLPSTMTVYNIRSYQLGDCTFNTGGHFVAILLWHGKLYYYDYDRIKSTKQQRLVECSPHLLTDLEIVMDLMHIPFIYTFLNLLELSLLTLNIFNSETV